MFIRVGLSLGRFTSNEILTKNLTCWNRESSGLKLLINKIFVTLVYIIMNTLIFALEAFVPVLSRWLLILCPLAMVFMHESPKNPGILSMSIAGPGRPWPTF